MIFLANNCPMNMRIVILMSHHVIANVLHPRCDIMSTPLAADHADNLTSAVLMVVEVILDAHSCLYPLL